MRLDNLTILIVEDEPIIALVLEDKLLDRGARPVLAHSFDSAAALISRQPLDLAILDVNIHGQQSYPLAQMLRDKGTPCIFVTGYGEALHPEAFEHTTTLTKPYSVAALDDALQNALHFAKADPSSPGSPSG